MSIPDAFIETDARYKAQVMHETWGHLEPKPGKYPGYIIFVNGTHGHHIAVDWEFVGIESCPGVYEDLNDTIYNWCQGRAKNIGVYKMIGTYTRFKNGNGRFGGKITKIKTGRKK